MENSTQEKRFIIKNFDKFKNRTDTSWKDPLAGKVAIDRLSLGVKAESEFGRNSPLYGSNGYLINLGICKG